MDQPPPPPSPPPTPPPRPPCPSSGPDCLTIAMYLVLAAEVFVGMFVLVTFPDPDTSPRARVGLLLGTAGVYGGLLAAFIGPAVSQERIFPYFAWPVFATVAGVVCLVLGWSIATTPPSDVGY